MLSILGAGKAYPDNIITNDFLNGIFEADSDRALIARLGISQRYSALPLDYIVETRNQSARIGIGRAISSPTDLAYLAAERAIRMAGIVSGDIGLIIGETLTPRETTPSEAQRLGGRLGIKTRAYDITSAGTSLACHLNVLSGWQVDLLPDYILLVSTSTLTAVTDYSRPFDAATNGDGASALVLSPTKPGKLKVIEATFNMDDLGLAPGGVDTYRHYHIDPRSYEEIIVEKTCSNINAANGHELKTCKFIGTQWSLGALQAVCRELNIHDDRHLYNLDRVGFIGGAGAGALLAEKWESFASGDRISIGLVGFDLSYGYALLEAA